MHGVLATTMFVGPVVVVNGPIRRRIGMNAKGNALGQGNRANGAIGRALQLVIRNIGGGRPQEVDRATLGNPGKLHLLLCRGRRRLVLGAALGRTRDEAGPIGGDGLRRLRSAGHRRPEVARPREPGAQLCRVAEGDPQRQAGAVPATRSWWSARSTSAPSGTPAGRRRGSTKSSTGCARSRGEELVAGAKGIAEGGPASLAGKTVNKFRPGGLMIVRAGGGAGMFSGIIGGWSQAGPAAASRNQGGAKLTVLLDPTSERSPTIRPRLPRPERLDGLTIGILDIAKARGDVFLNRLGERLGERGIAVRHYAKPTNTRVAPLPLRQQIATEVNLVIEGLSD